MLPASRIAFIVLLSGLSLAARCVETQHHPRADGDVCTDYCSGARPYCDPATLRCEACVTDEHCPSSTPTCRPSDHACYACTQNSECEATNAARCDTSTGSCGGCASDADCSRFSSKPVCDEPTGRCVACTRDTEAARCGANSCSLASHTCTATARGSLVRCGACTADTECPSSDVCVQQEVDGTSIGTFCVPTRPAGGCGGDASSLAPNPFTRSFESTTTDGIPSIVCMPPSSVSCNAIALRAAPCDSPGVAVQSDACGNEQVHDGFCVQFPTESKKCTYPCIDLGDCAPMRVCGVNPDAATAGSFCH